MTYTQWDSYQLISHKACRFKSGWGSLELYVDVWMHRWKKHFCCNFVSLRLSAICLAYHYLIQHTTIIKKNIWKIILKADRPHPRDIIRKRPQTYRHRQTSDGQTDRCYLAHYLRFVLTTRLYKNIKSLYFDVTDITQYTVTLLSSCAFLI